MATVNSRIESPGGSFGPRKTLIIMVTVVGCIAILWPKVFYPMMVGPTQTKSVIKDHRGSGCCDVVLDQEETYANVSIDIPSQQNLFRKRNIGPTVEDSSIRQERPPHLRPDTIHPAMRERGRAIPHVGSVHSERPQSTPRIVEGRPGPIPGMRPPMGAGSHQSTKSANSMGFIMPLYTIGIVSFFIYTILKLIFKKTPATPYPEIKPDTTFRNEVFTTPDPYIKRPDSGTTKLGQPIANGENGAPVSVGPVSNGSASTNFSHSVQAEISVDYQQLAAKPEPRPVTTDSSVEEEQVLVTATPADHGKSNDASSAPKETINDEYVQPEYDPATEKVVDGIVVQKVVRLDEGGTSNEIIERVASQVVEEVLQEAESKINEAAEAAAVELVEKVVEQAEATALAVDIDESAGKEESITSAEEATVLEALSEAVGEQASSKQEEVVCDASVPEVVEDVEPILISKEVALAEAVREVVSEVTEPFEKPQEDKIEATATEANQEETAVELPVMEASTTDEVIKVSEEPIATTASKVDELDEQPQHEEVETVIKATASEAFAAKESFQVSEDAAFVVEDTIQQSEQNSVEPMKSKVTSDESTTDEPVSEAVIIGEPIHALNENVFVAEVDSKVEDTVDASEEELVETESQVIREEVTVEIAVSDEATVEDVLQALKQVTFADEEPVKKAQEEIEMPSEHATAQTEACEPVTKSTFDDEVVESIEKDTPIEVSTSNVTIDAEELVESSGGVTFDDEVVDIVSQVEELVEKLPEVVEEPAELALVTSTVEVVVDNSITTDTDTPIDAEEATIKALAAKMEEEIAQQSEETEVRAVAEELVNEVLEQAESIAEEAEVDSFVLPSFDPATQKLVDGEIINRFAPEDVAPEITGESSSAAEPAIEEVVEKVSVQEVSAVDTTKLSVESPVEMGEAFVEVKVDTENSEKTSDEVDEGLVQTEASEKEIVQEFTVLSFETEEKSPVIEEPTEKADAEELTTENVEIQESSSEPAVGEESIITEKVETMVEQVLLETSHEQNKTESLTMEFNVSAESEQPEDVSQEIAKELTSPSMGDTALALDQPVEEDVIVAEISKSTEAVQESVVESSVVEESRKSSEPAETIESSEAVPVVTEEPLASENATMDETNAQVDSLVEASEMTNPVHEIVTVAETTSDSTTSHESTEDVSATVTDSEELPGISESVSEVQSVETEAAMVVEESVSTKEPSMEEQITVEESNPTSVPDSEIQLEYSTETDVDSNQAVEDNVNVPDAPVAVESVDETKAIESSVEQRVVVNETSEVTHSATPGEIRKEEPVLESSTSVQVEAVSGEEIKVLELPGAVESPSAETETKEAAQTSESAVAETVEEEVAVEKNADLVQEMKEEQETVETESENVIESVADETKETPFMDDADVISDEVKVTDIDLSVETAVEESVIKEDAIVREVEPIEEMKEEQVPMGTGEQTATEITSAELKQSTMADATEVKDLEQESESAVNESEKEEVAVVEEAKPIEIVKEEQVSEDTEGQKVPETTSTEAKETPLTDVVETIAVEDESCLQKSEEQLVAEPEKPAEIVMPAEDVVSETIITTEVLHHTSSTKPVILSYDEAAVEVDSVSEVSVEEPEESSSKLTEDSLVRGPTIEEIHDETVDASDEGKTSDEFAVKVEVEKVDTSEMISEVTDEPSVTSSVPSVSTAPVLDIISENQEDAELAEIEREAAEAKLIEQIGAGQDHYTKEKLDHVAKEAQVERTLTEATAVATEIEQIVDHIITEKIMHVIPSEVCSQDVAQDQTASEAVSEPEKLASSAAKVVESFISEEKVLATSSATSTVPASSSCPAEANNSINQLSTSTDTNLPECPSTQSSSTTLPSSSPAVDPISSKIEQEDDLIVRDAPISNLNFAVVEETQDAGQHTASSAEHVISSSNSCTITSLTQHPEAISSSNSSSSSAAIIDQETEETDNTEKAEKVTEQNGHVCKPVEQDTNKTAESEMQKQDEQLEREELLQQQPERTEQKEQLPEAEEDAPKVEQQHPTAAVPKKREASEDRNLLKVIPMEKRAAYEPGQRSSRPGTPVQHVTLDQSLIEDDAAESKCILLDANVPQKVSVADSELAVETLEASQKRSEETPFDLNLVVVFESLSNLNQGRSLEVNVLLGSEPTTMVAQPSSAARVASPTREVVLSGMMKLSLVKLDDSENTSTGDVVLKAKDAKKGGSFGAFGPNEE